MSSRTSTPPPGDPAGRALRWQFADCVLDGRTLELTVRGQLVKLEPKPLDLLMFLLRHPGEVVTKDELQDGVWPGRILSESVLTKAMAKLRQGLGDEEQAIVKTVHGYGYRLIAPLTVEALGPSPAPPQLGFEVGDAPPLRPNWKLLQRLGGGGYGDVWLAVHDKTAERRVFKFALDAQGLTALKREITLFRLLKDTYGERRDLVRLLDWNIDEPPYFIEAEYARGGSLPQWAEAQGGLAQVPLSQRLELVAQAADALAAAHAAAVLHKDLKPSNLLVDLDDAGQPYIRLGDFGSGRFLDLARLEQLEITRMGFTRAAGDEDPTSGTPRYFAPELLAGQSPTVQTDIYALGVILYQMIVADLTRPLAPGWEREIDDELLREDVAAAAAGQPAARLTDAADVARRLRALAARRRARTDERERAADNQRLTQRLENLRAARRRLIPLVAVLLLGTVATSIMAWRASQARNAAEHEAAKSDAINRYLNDDLLNAANPLQRPPGAPEVTVRAALETAAATVDTRFAGQPAVAASVLVTLGVLRHEFGEYDAAIALLDRAIAKGAAPEAQDEVEKARLERAAVLISANRDDEAIAALESLLAERSARLGAGHRDVLETQLRLIEARSTRSSDPVLLAELASLRSEANRVLGEPNWIAGEAGDLIASIHRMSGVPERGADDARQAYRALSASFGPDHPSTLKAQINLAHSLNALGDKTGAVQALRQAFGLMQARYGADGTDTLYLQNELGFILNLQGRYAEAEPLFADLVARREQRGEGGSLEITAALSNLANARLQLGRSAEALALVERGLRVTQGLDQPQPARTAILRRLQAESLLALGHSDEARAALDAGDITAAELPATDLRRLALQGARARWLLANGQAADGKRQLDGAISALREQVKDDHPLLAPLLTARTALP